MSTITTPLAGSRRRRPIDRRAGCAATGPAAPSTAPVATGVATASTVREPSLSGPVDRPVNPHHRGGTVVFEVRFSSAMAGEELALLRSELGATTHVEHKLPADPNSPALIPLDDESSLILERGTAADRWILQARTWGRPSARTVHDWHVRAAQVAHRLDPRTPLPERLPVQRAEVPQRPVGRAANRRLSTARRRLVGLR